MIKLTNKPLVSVIMPVYNAGDFLVEAIESVLGQTHRNFEIIAVDDGSNDDSYRLLKVLSKRDRRLKVYKLGKNCGLGKAANLGINKAKGKFLVRMDADDIMPFYRLEKQVEFLKKNPQVVALGGQCVLINKNGGYLGKKKFPLKNKEIKKYSFLAMTLQAGTMMMNKSLLPLNFDFYTSNYRYAEDHELLFKLFYYGRVANLPDILLYYRQHNGNSTNAVKPKEIFAKIAKIRKKAIKKGYFKPSLGIKVLSLLEGMLVYVLPEKAILTVYSLLRGTGESAKRIRQLAEQSVKLQFKVRS